MNLYRKYKRYKRFSEVDYGFVEAFDESTEHDDTLSGLALAMFVAKAEGKPFDPFAYAYAADFNRRVEGRISTGQKTRKPSQMAVEVLEEMRTPGSKANLEFEKMISFISQIPITYVW